MVTASQRYRKDFEPRIGPDAVEAYLTYRRTLRYTRLMRFPNVLVVLMSIWLHNFPLLAVAALMWVGTGYYLIGYGWRYRRKAQRFAKQFLDRPESSGGVPISGNAQLFDGWLRAHKTADAQLE
jgi:hypothetical protein